MTHLQAIKKKWEESRISRPFYYLGDSHNGWDSMCKPGVSFPTRLSEDVVYDWFEFLQDDTDDDDPRIIVMLPAIRPSMKSELGGEAVFSQLLSSLTVAHSAGVLHCDVRSSNCLEFAEGGWQVIDYDLSVSADEGECKLYRESDQFKCAGEDVKAKYELVVTSRHPDGIYEREISIDWTVHDDVCMLFKTCTKNAVISSANDDMHITATTRKRCREQT